MFKQMKTTAKKADAKLSPMCFFIVVCVAIFRFCSPASADQTEKPNAPHQAVPEDDQNKANAELARKQDDGKKKDGKKTKSSSNGIDELAKKLGADPQSGGRFKVY